MIRLGKALSAWGTPGFETILKQEIAQLGADSLPLQQGLSSGSYVMDAPVTAVINRVTDSGNTIRIMAGIFYQGGISGCNCSDDPAPASVTEYCEVQIKIDKTSATATIALATA